MNVIIIIKYACDIYKCDKYKCDRYECDSYECDRIRPFEMIITFIFNSRASSY